MKTNLFRLATAASAVAALAVTLGAGWKWG
jgi:hypothetical protein